ncbi:MAG: Hsp20/alpha crystallin family protein [Ferruginibacter sp.]
MNNPVRKNSNNAWRFNLENFFDNNLDKADMIFPAVNISENDECYMVEVAAPGFKKENFKLKVDDDILTIAAAAEKENNKDKNDRNEYTRREYSYKAFSRSFMLPDNIKDDAITASYNDGILKLQLPKSATQVKATKEITVK